MPPKPRYSRDTIVSAALEIVRRDGLDALTARTLGSALGASSQPIFTIFRNMDEVQSEVRIAARMLYGEYVKRGLDEEKPFLGVGKQYILFATNEPKLFQLLFMTEKANAPDVYKALPLIDENYLEILRAAAVQNDINEMDATRLYRHLWVYTHGIATLCATGVARLTHEELTNMLQDVSTALIDKLKRKE